MSSDYLNYELSKELHDLGVVFEDYNHWVYPDGTTGEQKELRLVDSTGSPSTAMLIDEIQRRGGFCLDDKDDYFVVSVYKIAGYSATECVTCQMDKCATTALGKALIALVKEGK